MKILPKIHWNHALTKLPCNWRWVWTINLSKTSKHRTFSFNNLFLSPGAAYSIQIRKWGLIGRKKLSLALLYTEHLYLTYVQTDQSKPEYIPNRQKEENYKKLLAEISVLNNNRSLCFWPILWIFPFVRKKSSPELSNQISCDDGNIPYPCCPIG